MKPTLYLSIAIISMFSFALVAGAAPVEKVEGFVCPVFNSNSAVGEHNPNAVPIANGDYTILGPTVNVPMHATNGNGVGSPGGPHSSPGDSDYTAIWNTER